MSTTHQAISSYAKMITKSQNQDVANVDTKVKGLTSQSMIRSFVNFIIGGFLVTIKLASECSSLHLHGS